MVGRYQAQMYNTPTHIQKSVIDYNLNNIADIIIFFKREKGDQSEKEQEREKER